MFFPSLRTHIAQALPDPIQNRLGLPSQSQQFPAGQATPPQPADQPDQYGSLQTPGQPPEGLLSPGQAIGQVGPTAPGVQATESIRPKGLAQPAMWKAALKGKLGGWKQKLSAMGHRKPKPPEPPSGTGAVSKPGEAANPSGESPGNQPLPNSQTTPPAIPEDAPPGSAMARGVSPSVPGARIRPLTVDELFNRPPFKKVKAAVGPQIKYIVKKPHYTLTPEEISINYPRKQQECLERLVYALPWKDHDVINPFDTGPYSMSEE